MGKMGVIPLIFKFTPPLLFGNLVNKRTRLSQERNRWKVSGMDVARVLHSAAQKFARGLYTTRGYISTEKPVVMSVTIAIAGQRPGRILHDDAHTGEWSGARGGVIGLTSVYRGTFIFFYNLFEHYPRVGG